MELSSEGILFGYIIIRKKHRSLDISRSCKPREIYKIYKFDQTRWLYLMLIALITFINLQTTQVILKCQATTVAPIAKTTTPTPTPSSTTTTQAPGIPCNEEEKKIRDCWSGQCRNVDGIIKCICEPGFYGERCDQTNFCEVILIADEQMNGRDICDRWTSKKHCIEDPSLRDHWLRCACDKHESFVFLNKTFYSQEAWSKLVRQINEKAPDPHSTVINGDNNNNDNNNNNNNDDQVKYLARCLPAEKCYGIKCRHLSEICLNGKCECNLERGYWRQPDSTGECKLINPCLDNTNRLCGRAKCIGTFDSDLYQCQCPLGKHARQLVMGQKNTTICENIMVKHDNKGNDNDDTDTDTDTDTDSDDENDNYNNNNYNSNSIGNDSDDKSAYSDKLDSNGNDEKYETSLICANPMLNPCQHICNPQTSKEANGTKNDDFKCSCLPGYEPGSSQETKNMCFYKRDLEERQQQDTTNANILPSLECKRRLACKENEICIVNSRGHEQCHCKRQGFVRLASSKLDKTVNNEKSACVDWCWAARQDARLADTLDQVCLSGVCQMQINPDDKRYETFESDSLKMDSQVEYHFGDKKPKFECDCSESKRLFKNELGFCELNFTAILEVCMPGNDGYNDCVINKGAYCSIMHQDVETLREELKSKRRLSSSFIHKSSSSSSIINNDLKSNIMNDNNNNSSIKLHQERRYFYDIQFAMKMRQKKLLEQEKMRILNKNITLYACVCPPDKRMIVDKERGRAVCIKECQLMSDKCSRMNRMCKRAQFNPFDSSYKQRNLIRRDWQSSYPPGSQWLLDIEPAGCQCLPGFSPNSTLINSSMDPDQLVYPSHMSTFQLNPTQNCFSGDDVIKLANVIFKAPANFDLTWLRPVNESSWLEWMPTQENVLIPVPAQVTNANSTQLLNQNQQQQQQVNLPIKSVATTTTDSHWFIPQYNEQIPQEPAWTRLREPNLLIKQFALVGQCSPSWAQLSPRMYYECIGYRYWQEHVLKRHYIDWRRLLKQHLSSTFNLMHGFVELNVDNCKAIVRTNKQQTTNTNALIDISNDKLPLDGEVYCNLTLHIAKTNPNLPLKIAIGPEMKQLAYDEPDAIDLDQEAPSDFHEFFEQPLSSTYIRLAPSVLITRTCYKYIMQDTHNHPFKPCLSADINYCSNSTQCIAGDGIRFECKCALGFQAVADIDISRAVGGATWKREICEDIDECLFDVCGENTLRCRNLIGDYKCDCLPKYVLDGRNCVPMCDKVNCKHGTCRFQGDYHATCECEDGYIGPDCGQLDPSIALRKANIIICISIFGSILVLAIAVAFSQHKQLKKTRTELKLLRQENDPMRMYDFYLSRQAAPIKTSHRSKHSHHQHWNSISSASNKAR